MNSRYPGLSFDILFVALAFLVIFLRTHVIFGHHSFVCEPIFVKLSFLSFLGLGLSKNSSFVAVEWLKVSLASHLGYLSRDSSLRKGQKSMIGSFSCQTKGAIGLGRVENMGM